jgi:putative glutamine amidotransferase
MPRPLVALPADFRRIDNGHSWHAAVATYVDAVQDVARCLPLIVPALGDRLDLDALFAKVDGVLLTGSRSNVHPARYGVAPAPDYEPYDEARDATTLPLIEAALARGVPLLAICRGFQELNVALGGTLGTEIQELPGRLDHRSPVSDDIDVRYAIRQRVTIAREGCLGRVLGEAEIAVNSLHRQGVAVLAGRLDVEALAEDGTIEAVSVRGAPGFAMGVQWHPEYWARTDAPSRRLLEAFGEAVRARAAGVAPAALAAE